MAPVWRREPARVLAVISAGLALCIGFGLDLSGQQVNYIMIFAAAVLALITGEATRSQVVPMDVADRQMEIAKTVTRVPANRTDRERGKRKRMRQIILRRQAGGNGCAFEKVS